MKTETVLLVFEELPDLETYGSDTLQFGVQNPDV